MSLKTILLMSSDKMLGVVGGGMALASVSFGVYMNVNGPAPGSLGKSHDFTVFAQLAPRGTKAARPVPDRHPDPDEDLDMMATASIPGHVRAGGPADGDSSRSDRATNPAVTLESADADAATVAVAGELRVVHVGDTIPGAGEVLAIYPGARPSLKTAQGLIVSAR